MRLILFLGKGGTGKTTVAAATGVRCSELGQRTLVVSTDIAHSLADVFDRPLGPQPTAVAEHLWAQEINVVDELRSQWSKLQSYVDALLRQRGMSQVIAEELAIVPGMEEIAGLLHIHQYSRESSYDIIIVDAAPTGETIRLLGVPETFRWYFGRLERGRDQVRRLAQLFGLVSGHEMFERLSDIDARVAELRKTLTDPGITSCRVVLNPEKIVIKEAQRALTYLNLYNYPVDAAVINRVLPARSWADPYLLRMQEIQQAYLQLITDTFAPLPLFQVPWYEEEIIGLGSLAQLAGDMWTDQDPSQQFWLGPTQEIVESGGELILRLSLPHIEIEKVAMAKRGDELFITIGNFKRELLLPRALAMRDARSAFLTEEGLLEVHFVPPSLGQGA